MEKFYIFSVYLHLICAAFWIGGMLFLPLVLLPSIKNHPNRIELLYKTGIKFRFFGWIALAVLLITGLLNLHLKGLPFSWEFFTQNVYGQVTVHKLIGFVLILLLSAIHDFAIGGKAIEEMKTTNNSRFIKFARWGGRINLILALLLAYFGVVLSRGGF